MSVTGLINGVMGTIVNILKDEEEVNVKVILVKFDHSDVGQSARGQSLYKKINRNTVPIVPFQINSSSSYNASRLQFPLKLSWAVTIHKCQGLTLDQIVIDMSPNKGKYYPGQAYVGFSRVKTLDGLHVINYTQSQIKISPNVEEEMERLRQNCLPQLPTNLFESDPGHIKLLHINIRNVHRKPFDMKCNNLLKLVDIICINETHLSKTDPFESNMLNLGRRYAHIYRKDRDMYGGGVAIVINKKLHPQEICIGTVCELVSIRICAPEDIVLICVYQPPLNIYVFISIRNE